MQNKKNLIILIEIKKRELISKLVLSEFALKKKYRIFIGNTSSYFWALKKKVLPKGIILLKSIEHKDLSYLRQYKNQNAHIVCLDEEGGQLRSSIANFFKQRVSDESLSFVSSFYNWGKLDYNYSKKHYLRHNKKFKLTGSPRIDLLNPKLEYIFEDKVKELKKKYKKYVLICTNFGLSNSHYTDKEKIKIETKNRRFKKNSEINWLKKYMKEERKLMFKFIDLCNYLSNHYKNLNFVFRPHPAENISTYNKHIFNKNVIIENDGNAIDWIKGSIAHIHNGCTTGFESFALKKKVFSYEPFKTKFIDNITSNKISYRIKNKKDFLNNIFESKKINFTNKKKRNIFNYRYKFSDNFNSYEIIKNLNELKIQKADFKYKLRPYLIKRLLQFIQYKVFDYKFKSKYYKEKNKLVQKNDIIKFFKKNKKMSKIKINKLIEGLFCIESKY